MTKTVRCDSGLRGWQGKLRDQYDCYEQFEACSDTYGLAERPGFESTQDAWDANPTVQGSVEPSDYKVVKP